MLAICLGKFVSTKTLLKNKEQHANYKKKKKPDRAVSPITQLEVIAKKKNLVSVVEKKMVVIMFTSMDGIK